MEIAIAVVVIAGATALIFLAWQRRRLASAMNTIGTYNEYVDLRSQAMAAQGEALPNAFDHKCDLVIAALGPKFDPRRSAWGRLQLLEPNLRDFVTAHIDPAAHPPDDLEAFGESILYLEAGGFRGITPNDWLEAAKHFTANAASWRSLPRPVGRGLDTNAAIDEAVAVARTFFAFGTRAWDRTRQAAFDKW